MDYNKIGKFIADERKRLGLTQAKLAGKLYVSEKTVSKWENGKGLPDTTILKALSEIFSVTINELLSGERVSGDDYKDRAESRLLEMQERKQHSDKILLIAEIIVSVLALIIFFTAIGIFSYLSEIGKNGLGILVLVVGVVIFIVTMPFALLIEQKAGYYMCCKCEHKYIPTYRNVLIAPHINRSRFMKCPNCKKWSYHKKVIK